MKRWIGWLLVALLGATLCPATIAQTAITVLDIDPGVRLLGSGGAGIAVVSGAETLYYNPAGLADLPGLSFSSFYASYLGVANYSAFALTLRNWGIGALLFSSGGIPGYDDGGVSTGNLAYNNSAILFGFGLRPSDIPFIPTMPFDFALGGRIKYVSANVAETKGTGFSFDLGFRTMIPDVRLGPISISDAALGVSIVNVFGNLGYETTQERFPMDIRLGASAVFLKAIQLALDLSLGGALNVGVSYSPVNTLAVRLGAISKGGGLSITAGVGVGIEGFLIDYAYVSHTLGGTHRVSLSLDFSALDFSAIGRSLRRILP